MRRLMAAAAGVFMLDVATKLLANWLLMERVVRLGMLLELRITHNTGMALGIFAGSELAGYLMPPIVIACGWWLMRRYRMTGFTQMACGIIVGGFLGNYLNRIISGHVLDMIHFPFMPWFVCNVADIAICAGVAMLAISLIARPKDWQEVRQKGEH